MANVALTLFLSAAPFCTVSMTAYGPTPPGQQPTQISFSIEHIGASDQYFDHTGSEYPGRTRPIGGKNSDRSVVRFLFRQRREPSSNVGRTLQVQACQRPASLPAGQTIVSNRANFVSPQSKCSGR